MRKIPSLDGWRALSVIWLISFHCMFYLTSGFTPESKVILFNDIFFNAMWAGSFGVVVFFVLSGFLITRILITEKDRTGQVDFKKFYFRRATRILPCFYLVLLMS